MSHSTVNWKLPTIIIATVSAALLLYALYNKNKDQRKVTPHKKVHQNEPMDVDEKTNDSSSLPLPGKCSIKPTFILSKDLKILKNVYKQYKELLPRSFNIINKDLHNEKNGFSVMQFNMLADGLSGAYSAIQSEKTFLGVDKKCLEWTYRGIRICEEITRFNPDIVCIQECDQIECMQKYLKPFGYNAHFQIIYDSPTQKVAKQLSAERNVKIELSEMYIAIFYKHDRFDLNGSIQQIDKRQNVANVSALAVPLRCKQDVREFLCISTHLKSKKTEKGEQIRKQQIELLLKDLIKNERNIPVLLCCDLNANPITNKHGYAPLCYDAIVSKENGIGYSSIYKMANGKEPEYTTWKCRESGVDKHTIDYIFVNDVNVWKVSSILEIPQVDEKELEGSKALIPSWQYPSDHFSLMANLHLIMDALKVIDSLLQRMQSNKDDKSMIIAIGSTNPTKIKSVQMAVAKLFPNQRVSYEYASVKSGVSDQPKSSSESVKGATNRAKNVFKLFPNATYCVGIEGGIETVSDDITDKCIYLQSGWVVVMNRENKIGIGSSARVELSEKVMQPILNDGKELGDVMDEMSGEHSTKTHQGYFGLVANNNLPRADAYEHGVLFAFAKFVSPKIYWD